MREKIGHKALPGFKTNQIVTHTPALILGEAAGVK